MKKLLLSGILVLLSTGAVNDANAHPGRTNSEGCHNDRKNGGYHCHGAKRKSADYFASEPAAPARSPEKKSANKKPSHTTPRPSISTQKPENKVPQRPVDNPQERMQRCVNSKNIHAYWEPTTKRCLDSKTGREAAI
ncbi:DUF1283 domain-containing protein [Pantoea endophytica]